MNKILLFAAVCIAGLLACTTVFQGKEAGEEAKGEETWVEPDLLAVPMQRLVTVGNEVTLDVRVINNTDRPIRFDRAMLLGKNVHVTVTGLDGRQVKINYPEHKDAEPEYVELPPHSYFGMEVPLGKSVTLSAPGVYTFRTAYATVYEKNKKEYRFESPEFRVYVVDWKKNPEAVLAPPFFKSYTGKVSILGNNKAPRKSGDNYVHPDDRDDVLKKILIFDLSKDVPNATPLYAYISAKHGVYWIKISSGVFEVWQGPLSISEALK